MGNLQHSGLQRASENVNAIYSKTNMPHVQRYTDLIRNRGRRTGRVLRDSVAHLLDAYLWYMCTWSLDGDISWEEPGWWTSSISLEMTSNRDMMEGIGILPLLLTLYCHYAFTLQRVPKTYLEICMAWLRRPPITPFITLPGPSLSEREIISFSQEEETWPE